MKSIKKYRGKDRPTDVISFAIEDGLDEDFMSAFSDDPDFVEDIGDLFLCPEVIKRHSVEYETGFNREFGYTLVHGYLHLNGYDHIEDDEAKVMLVSKVKFYVNMDFRFILIKKITESKFTKT